MEITENHKNVTEYQFPFRISMPQEVMLNFSLRILFLVLLTTKILICHKNNFYDLFETINLFDVSNLVLYTTFFCELNPLNLLFTIKEHGL